MLRKNKNEFKLWYAISLALQLGFVIIFLIGGFMLLGWWADRIFNTSPLLMIAALVIGLLVTGYQVYHLLLPLIKEK